MVDINKKLDICFLNLQKRFHNCHLLLFKTIKKSFLQIEKFFEAPLI